MVEVGMEQPGFLNGIPPAQYENPGIYASIVLPVSPLFQVQLSHIGDPADGNKGYVALFIRSRELNTVES